MLVKVSQNICLRQITKHLFNFLGGLVNINVTNALSWLYNLSIIHVCNGLFYSNLPFYL